MNAYIDGLKKYARFRGRATRSRYWLFILFMAITMMIGIVLDVALGTADEHGKGGIMAIIGCAQLLPHIAVTVRRLHDINRSGWWWWIILVPGAGAIVLLVFACLPSTPGTNRFGPPVGTTSSVSLAATGGLASASTVERLEKLASLRASGAIDDTEYQKMKADLLNTAGQ